MDWVVPSWYDFAVSSQQNYAHPAKDFRGLFQAIRAQLDFKYHGNYTPQRQTLQDILVHNVIGAGIPRKRPWIVFTAGAMGAGKSHTISWMNDRGFFPIDGMVQVDADNFRMQFPEWDQYMKRNPTTAGQNTHKEAAYLVEIAQEAGMALSKDIWVDGSLRDAEWYVNVFQRIRRVHPTYRIAIIHIHAEKSVIFHRVSKRQVKTGREVPLESVIESIKRVPVSVATLAPLADFVVEIENSSDHFQLPKTRDAFFQIAKHFAPASSAQSLLDQLQHRIWGVNANGSECECGGHSRL